MYHHGSVLFSGNEGKISAVIDPRARRSPSRPSLPKSEGKFTLKVGSELLRFNSTSQVQTELFIPRNNNCHHRRSYSVTMPTRTLHRRQKFWPSWQPMKRRESPTSSSSSSSKKCFLCCISTPLLPTLRKTSHH